MIRRPPRSTLFPTRRSSDLRYREVEPSSERRRRADALLAHGLLAIELVLCLSLFGPQPDRKSTRLNSSHANISYAVFCLKKKKNRKAGQSNKDVEISPRSMR